jgi:hypothetical protein
LAIAHENASEQAKNQLAAVAKTQPLFCRMISYAKPSFVPPDSARGFGSRKLAEEVDFL